MAKANLNAFLIPIHRGDINLRMWYYSRLYNNGYSIRVLTDTSTYRHWDAGYGPPSRKHSAQVVRQNFITPRKHHHLKSHDGAWHEEIEIELKDVEDASFNGTITMEGA